VVVFQPFGGARTVTGSRHLLKSERARVLLECGFFQGHREESDERNRHVPVLPLDAVILSHAHLDHSGALPSLVRDGFGGPIWSTPATRDLCRAMLADAAAVAAQDAEDANRRRSPGERRAVPVYLPEDVARALERFRTVPLGRPFDAAPGVRATFREAGHILGSAGVLVEFEGGASVYFTGDLGRRAYPILNDPEPLPRCDAVLCEATYGTRDHEPVEEAEAVLAALLRRAVEERGKVFVPAFSIGRTQNLVYGLSRGIAEGRYPKIPIFVDSPLATEATRVFAAHRDLYDPELAAWVARGGRPFDPPGIHYLATREESRALNDRPGPFVVIAGSGMCEGGRIVHHLKHGLAEARNAVLFVGYAARHTLARRIQDGLPFVRIHGREVAVSARVAKIGAWSAHADRGEILRFLEPAKAWGAEVFLVHGDEEASLALAEALRQAGHVRVTVPECYAEHPVGSGASR
jgi:metallo-beta-lactamase family protein